MTEQPSDLQPADRDDVLRMLAYALGFNLNGKARRGIDATERQIAAEALLEHLTRSGFVLMKKPPRPN
jgi:uncharacterized protein YbjT (DUF2867 family)